MVCLVVLGGVGVPGGSFDGPAGGFVIVVSNGKAITETTMKKPPLGPPKPPKTAKQTISADHYEP